VNSVAPCLLGLVERAIRLLQGSFRLQAVVFAEHDPTDAEGNRQAALGGDVNGPFGDSLPQRLCVATTARGAKSGRKANKFFPTIAVEQAGGPQLILQPPDDGLQHTVANVVAVAVVDLLKVIYIHHQQAEIAVASFPAGSHLLEQMGQRLIQSSPVQRPGQGIRQRQRLQQLVAGSQLPVGLGQSLGEPLET
jgi:hypothetical protein